MSALRLPRALKTGPNLVLKRLSLRDPRTVARDIPGVLDVLFPRLRGGLVASLNRRIVSFEDIVPVPDKLVGKSQLNKAILFEVAVARAEHIMSVGDEPSWEYCLRVAAERQRKHYVGRMPGELDQCDIDISDHTAKNLVKMLTRIQHQNRDWPLERSPFIPGMGWIASGEGDFAINKVLIEVKNTDRNFIAADYRQVLMYWMLKYSASIESGGEVWSEISLLNPRRNSALQMSFDDLLWSASANSNRIELFELLRSIVGQDVDRR